MDSNITSVQNSAQMLQILKLSPQTFLHPTTTLHTDIISLTKHYLDPISSTVSALQIERFKLLRKNRKRKRDDPVDDAQPLRLKTLVTEGFGVQQVWEQVARIAQAVKKESHQLIDHHRESDTDSETGSTKDVFTDDSGPELSDTENQVQLHEPPYEDSQNKSLTLDDDHDEEFQDSQMDHNDQDIPSIKDDKFEDGKEDNEEEEEYSDNADGASHNQIKSKQDIHGLNDDFFSIDDFNRRTRMLEKRDYSGEPDADAASDEEEIDWHVDPKFFSHSQNGLKDIANDSNEDEEMEGNGELGFGNMDLMAPEGASDDDMNDDSNMEDLEDMQVNQLNSNLMYDDFFGIDKKKKNEKKWSKSKASYQRQHDSASSIHDDVQRVISTVNHDLYSDDGIEDDEDDEDDAIEQESNESVTGDKRNLNRNKLLSTSSNHEKRQSAITAQIRELEALNISQKPWVLAGESKGKDRPINAILEQDLDFETTGKPLPVMTAEMSEDTVQMIKKRIIARDFQEVRRRRPDEALLASTKRGRAFDDPLDMSQRNERKGLADLYEEDHLKMNDPAYVDLKSEALNKDHAEIEALWKDIVVKLDSLASWSFRPKPVEAVISVRSDAPALTLEDARPSGVNGDVGLMNQLAPQEIYKPGDGKESGKVVLKTGTVVDRSEMSQDNRKRLRRRQKERLKKSQVQTQLLKDHSHSKTKDRDVHANGDKNSQSHAQAVAKDLKRSGVKIIGRKGELRNVDGDEVKENLSRHANSLKL